MKLIPEGRVVQGGQDLPKQIKRTLLYEQSTTRNGQHLPTVRLKITEHNSIIELPRYLKAVKDHTKIFPPVLAMYSVSCYFPPDIAYPGYFSLGMGFPGIFPLISRIPVFFSLEIS